MKRVLRSAFDPVPRPLSPGAQMLVVGVLIFGITISVVEYLEHSRPTLLAQPAADAPAGTGSEMGAATPVQRSARPRSLVRVAPRPATPSGATTTGAGGRPSVDAACDPLSPAAAPMSLQPGEDG